MSWVAAMAEALTLPLLLVRPSGRLLNANMAGMRELARATRLVHIDGVVHASDEAQRAAFAQCLALAASGGHKQQWDEQATDGPVLVAPVAGQATSGAQDIDAATLMLVLPPEASSADACTLFAYQYGLSQGEFEVLHALCTGHSPREIAQARGVSVSTVRTQLMRLRRKCGQQQMDTLVLPL
jgi:DNA-binding CsgD family transcriptional regulator